MHVQKAVAVLAMFAAALVSAVVFALPAQAADDDVWTRVRAGLFGARPIAEAGDDLLLTVPKRAEDAAVVPVSIRVVPRDAVPLPKKLYLVIDKNPSPVSAIFELGESVGRAEIETRVRVEDYSTVRAIAEAPDGSLTMATRFIKASGGCSAPANKREGDANTLGQMRWHLPESLSMGESNPVTLLIRHPNSSGLAMDQMTRLYEPPHFVRQVRVTYRDRLVLAADVDFSISENPAFRFTFKPDGEGTLKAEVADSKELAFESSVQIR